MTHARPILTALVLLTAVAYRLWSAPALYQSYFHFRFKGPTPTVAPSTPDGPYTDLPGDVVNLTRKLVSFGTREPHAYIAAWLAAANMSVHVQPMSADGTRANVLALPHAAAANTNNNSVRVLMFTHMDVVPGGPELDLYGTDGRLYGRGTTDARGILAAMMVAASNMVNSGSTYNNNNNVAILAVTGEETTHDGIRAVADWEAYSRYIPDNIILVNGEPTEGKLATKQKGILKFAASAKGKSAHSGYPSLGKSAIAALVAFLHQLDNTDWNHGLESITTSNTKDAGNTMNIGTIEGGAAANIVAGAARAVVAFRCVSPPQRVLEKVVAIAKRNTDIDIDIDIGEVKTAQPMQFHVPPGAARKYGTYEANYNTDVPSYPRKYRAAVLFGGGTIHVAHTDHEHTHIHDTLLPMPAQYEHIVRELLLLDMDNNNNNDPTG